MVLSVTAEFEDATPSPTFATFGLLSPMGRGTGTAFASILLPIGEKVARRAG
jgi:hypothetical protein